MTATERRQSEVWLENDEENVSSQEVIVKNCPVELDNNDKPDDVSCIEFSKAASSGSNNVTSLDQNSDDGE